MGDSPVGNITALRVLTDPACLSRYQHDEAEWAPYGTPPSGEGDAPRV
ncbi:hypothetical protein ABTZ57_39635 [Streptomyces sp. NPDC094048]